MTDGPTGEDPADPLLRAVAEYWDDIFRRADEQQAARLRAIVDGTAEPDSIEARAMLADELLRLLPPDHPVRRAMQRTIMYSTLDPDPGSRVAGAFRWLRTQARGGEPGDGATELDEFDRQVQARLLSLPALTAEEVRGNQVDPDGGGLIRLARPDRQVQLPAFQFSPGGQPWPVVREVNELLGAANDPWGVTCWWVDPHQWLAGSPRDLLGGNADDLLRSVAAAVGEDWLCPMTCLQRALPPGRGSFGFRRARSCGR